jgi:hypothetical protein
LFSVIIELWEYSSLLFNGQLLCFYFAMTLCIILKWRVHIVQVRRPPFLICTDNHFAGRWSVINIMSVCALIMSDCFDLCLIVLLLCLIMSVWYLHLTEIYVWFFGFMSDCWIYVWLLDLCLTVGFMSGLWIYVWLLDICLTFQFMFGWDLCLTVRFMTDF